MIYLLLFCSVSDIFLIEVFAVDNISKHNTNVRVGDGVKLNDADFVKNLIKNEIDESWSKIVSNLREQLVSYGRRIKFLEDREKRMQLVVDRMAFRMRTFAVEKKRERSPSLSHKNQENLNEQETVKRDRENVREDAEYRRDNFEGRMQSGVTDRKIKERGALQYRFRRHLVRQTGHVAFTAYLDHSLKDMNIGQTIRMNQVMLNDGNGYNQYTGIFTAPVSGIYMFTFHFDSLNHVTVVRLVMDRTEQIDAIVYPHNGYEAMSGNTAVVRVEAGQRLWLEDAIVPDGDVQSAETYRYCTFSGVLLY